MNESRKCPKCGKEHYRPISVICVGCELSAGNRPSGTPQAEPQSHPGGNAAAVIEGAELSEVRDFDARLREGFAILEGRAT
jgi:hypothetical protein